MPQVLRLNYTDHFCSQNIGVIFYRYDSNNYALCGCADYVYVFDYTSMRCITPDDPECAQLINYDGTCVSECEPLSYDRGICYYSNGVYVLENNSYKLVCRYNFSGDSCAPTCAGEQKEYNNQCYAAIGEAPGYLYCKDKVKLIDHAKRVMQLVDVCLESGKTVYFDGTIYRAIACPYPLGEGNSCCPAGYALFVDSLDTRCVEYDQYYNEFINCRYRTAVVHNGKVNLYCLAYEQRQNVDEGVNKGVLIIVYIVCGVLIVGVTVFVALYLYKKAGEQRSVASFTDKYGSHRYESVIDLTSSQVKGSVVFYVE